MTETKPKATQYLITPFAKFTWSVLAINILVILWGAFVRATGSGAGCGSHWPTCNGEVIPLSPQTETWIEFTHRLTSGLAFVLVLVMLIWSVRIFPKGHRVRKAAGFAMLFIISESLVGAGLVLFEWVAGNISTERVIVMGIHLLNTHLLLAAIVLTGWWASGGNSPRWKEQAGQIKWRLAIGIVGGAGNIHPKAKLCKKILGIKTAKELSEVVVSLGLAQNFAAVFALSTVGIQKGHMSLHAKNIAVMAGAKNKEIEIVADQLIKEENIKLDRAKEILKNIK